MWFHEAASVREAASGQHFLCLIQSFYTYQAEQTINYGLRVAWPSIGLKRPTASKDLSVSLELMRQDKFSLRLTSYQSQSPTRSRAYQASYLI